MEYVEPNHGMYGLTAVASAITMIVLALIVRAI